jgi:alkanesulfonate monooxygenase SsuD/methylene tetrahydromethanopterin reductase-like flavin-dependent oxidoreductase (luciferase family)
MTTLAALARDTERVRLGTLVLGAPFRPPAILAKMATAVDLVSGGRLDLGIGAGWYEDEFRAFGYDFGSTNDRFEILEETMVVLKALFADGPVDHAGKRFRLTGAYNRPAPAHAGGPPIWLGAKGGQRSLRLAARLADGWNTVWRWTLEDYADRVKAARVACEQEDRDPETLRLSVGLYTLVGEDRPDLERRYRIAQEWAPRGSLGRQSLEEYSRGALVGTPEQVLETAARFQELGVEEIVVSPAPVPFAIPDPSMLDVLSEAVIRGPR